MRLLVLILILSYMIRTLVIWTKSSRQEDKAFRSILALASFLLAFASMALHLYSAINIGLHPKIAFYEPTSLKVLRVGFWISTGGIALGLGSSGTLRWPSVPVSTLLAVLWFIIGTAE
jgi:hypothetical protein